MDPTPATRPQRPARPSAPRAAASPCLRATLEALILTLLAALLGPRRPTRAWHLAAAHLPTEHPVPRHAPTTPASTHQTCESPILYVIGPGPNPGLRPRPRATPIPRAAIARAPPRAPLSHIRAKPPSPRGRIHTPEAHPTNPPNAARLLRMQVQIAGLPDHHGAKPLIRIATTATMPGRSG